MGGRGDMHVTLSYNSSPPHRAKRGVHGCHLHVVSFRPGAQATGRLGWRGGGGELGTLLLDRTGGKDLTGR
eukprot:c44429_g1_i1 orf=28-240(+)